MNKQNFFFVVFDFDGVVCDSTDKCMVTSWNAWEEWESRDNFRNDLSEFSENYKLPNPIKDLNPYWKNPMGHGQIRACYGTKFLRDNKNWLS